MPNNASRLDLDQLTLQVLKLHADGGRGWGEGVLGFYTIQILTEKYMFHETSKDTEETMK